MLFFGHGRLCEKPATQAFRQPICISTTTQACHVFLFQNRDHLMGTMPQLHGMGAVGGLDFHFLKGLHNPPKDQHFRRASQAACNDLHINDNFNVCRRLLCATILFTSHNKNPRNSFSSTLLLAVSYPGPHHRLCPLHRNRQNLCRPRWIHQWITSNYSSSHGVNKYIRAILTCVTISYWIDRESQTQKNIILKGLNMYQFN